MNDAELLAEYERQVRRATTLGPGWRVDQSPDGRVIAHVPPAGSGTSATVIWSDLDESTADAAVAEAVTRYDPPGLPWEWKSYGHDRPADLGERLAAAGFASGDVEAVVIGETQQVLAACGPGDVPDGVTIRPLRGPEDYARIVAMESAAFEVDMSWLGSLLPAAKAADPDALHFFLAEDAERELVSAGWVHFQAGTDFAGFFGGGTLARMRGRGIYRTLVRLRAELAAERGCRFLHVDASPNSRPILERLGFRAVTTTTPYTHRPGGAA